MHNLEEWTLPLTLPGAAAHLLMSPTERLRAMPDSSQLLTAKKAGVLIYLYEADGEIILPFIRRVSNNSVHSGQIAFPGGRREEEDADMIATALREAREEVGIDPFTVRVLGPITDVYTHPSHTLVTPVVGIGQGRPIYRRQPEEVDEILEIKLSDLLNPAHLRRRDIEVRGGWLRAVPCVEVAEVVIWGATACMLSELAWIISGYPVFDF